MAYELKQGSLLPTYVVQLKELVGTPQERVVPGLDDPGIAGFRFLMRHDAAATEDPPLIDGDAHYWIDPDDAAAYTASIEYIWIPGDTDIAPGNYQVEIWVEWVAGKYEKFPNKGYFSATINADLGPTTLVP